jgi:hypothetical protein
MGHYWKDAPFRTTTLAAAVLAGFLMFTAAPLLRADEHDCQRRIAKADRKLDQAVAHHGPRSHQAEKARHDLHEAREHCWQANHRWWDEREHRWHTERDWDDNDHDRDHH